tara:strand:+ start:75 stop:1118 length:1044 start_codon:yes stop_codon:yes gene_type:complete
MDAYQIFWDYHSRNKKPTVTKNMQPHTLKLVNLIQNTFPTRVGTLEPPTAPNSPLEGPIGYQGETKDSDPVAHCDRLFVNKKWHQSQINNLAKYTRSVVCMKWVKAVASKVQGPIVGGFVALHDSDRHLHVIGGGVETFLELLFTASAHQIEPSNGKLLVTPSQVVTTFSWSTTSTNAIHIQDLQLAMTKQTHCKKFIVKKTSSKEQMSEWKQKPQKRVVDESPFLLLMVACSIGIPTKQLYKSHEFIQRWENYRFKSVSEATIITTILRDKFGTLEKMGVESTQLLDEYLKQIALFSPVEQSITTVDKYFWDQWYSYPSPFEMKHLLHRVTVLKNNLLRPMVKLSI